MTSSAATTAIAIDRLAQRNGPATPAVAIVATAPGIAGDVIDPLGWAERLAETRPDEAADVRAAVDNLLLAYAALIG